MATALIERDEGSRSLVEILDRVLDKGLVVTGDIKVSVAEVELLTISIRLLICSIDKAEQIGIDWWKSDQRRSSGKQVRAAGTARGCRAKTLAGKPPSRLTHERRSGPCP